MVSINEGDGRACNLDGAVQGHNLEPPHGHFQALMHQACCDWRTVDSACMHACNKVMCCCFPVLSAEPTLASALAVVMAV